MSTLFVFPAQVLYRWQRHYRLWRVLRQQWRQTRRRYPRIRQRRHCKSVSISVSHTLTNIHACIGTYRVAKK